MTFVLNHATKLTITDESTATAAIGSGTTVYSGYDESGSIRSDATAPAVPCTKFAYFSKAMSGGAATIDLTSLTNQAGDSVDGTGLKVQFYKFKNPSTNANNITIVDGATNGYNIFGDASGQVTLLPGQYIQGGLAEAADDIGVSDLAIDISGTGTQALECTIVMG